MVKELIGGVITVASRRLLSSITELKPLWQDTYYTYLYHQTDIRNSTGTCTAAAAAAAYCGSSLLIAKAVLRDVILGLFHSRCPASLEVNRAIMKVLLQTLYHSIVSCCARGGDGGSGHVDNDDDDDSWEEQEYVVFSESAAVDEETQILLQTSMKDRIQDYQNAVMGAGNKTESGSSAGAAPSSSTSRKTRTPYKREKSTSNVIEQFENMAADELLLLASSSSGLHHHQQRRRRPRTPLGEHQFSSSNRSLTKSPSSAASSFSSIQSHIKNNVKGLPPCAACLETIYPTDPTIQTYGRTLHASCFACRLCQAKLKHHPMEVQFMVDEMIETENTEVSPPSAPSSPPQSLYCICGKCQFECMIRDKPKVVGTVAGEKIGVSPEELGDVQGVKDAIGDELEEILLEKTVPRCQVCGGDFLNYTSPGRVCIIGQMKYHSECWETGKPSANLADRQLIPYQAAKYLPDRWIVRLVLIDEIEDKYEELRQQQQQQQQGKRPLATLFFVWSTRMADFKRCLSTGRDDSIFQIELELDDQAMGNPNYYADPSKRKTQVSLPVTSGSTTNLYCELIGNPLSNTLLTCSRAMKRDRIQMQLQGTKYHVTHTMSLTIPILQQKKCNSSSSKNKATTTTTTTFDLSRVRLTVSLC